MGKLEILGFRIRHSPTRIFRKHIGNVVCYYAAQVRIPVSRQAWRIICHILSLKSQNWRVKSPNADLVGVGAAPSLQREVAEEVRHRRGVGGGREYVMHVGAGAA